jgi:hypothetical protein
MRQEKKTFIYLYIVFHLFRYSSNKTKFTEYHFGSPVMRLLYIQNKTDLAIQLFMDEVNLIFTKKKKTSFYL